MKVFALRKFAGILLDALVGYLVNKMSDPGRQCNSCGRFVRLMFIVPSNIKGRKRMLCEKCVKDFWPGV